jgi:acyl carrier protein
MKIADFIESFVEELEIESTDVSVETNIKDLDEWDSMTAMILIGFVSNNFKVTLNADDIKALTTVQSLIDKIGIEKFN